MALASAGCGGGSGGGGPVVTPPTGTNVSVTGTVKDTTASHNPVANSEVTIVGTSLTTHTDASGNFSFASVPATATTFKISRPTGGSTSYFSYANYGGKFYDIIDCSFPLGTLHAGTNTLGEIDLFIDLGSPPPPPVGGCP